MATDEPTKTHSEKAGMLPGTLLHIGERNFEDVKITVIDYDEKGFQERQVENIEECLVYKQTPTVTWINIDGIHEVEIIEKIGEYYDFHPLILEDIVTAGQRPKCDDYEDYIYVVLRMLSYDWRTESIETEQVSIILGRNYVISFQEKVGGDVFDKIRDRIRTAKGKIRKMSADYLAYSLIDAIVDNYFVVLERLTERMETLEEELLAEPTSKTLQEIHKIKKELLFLRKSVWPLRELVGKLEKTETLLIKKTTLPYLRDIYDHTIQVIDTVETFRDVISYMLEIYLLSISNRLNSIMKVLTVITTIFMPLSFIVGLYGMNFKYMPEIEWQYGYLFVLILIVTIAFGMLYYFRKKKWI
jgi:magnesium transporter